jgi:hypothetical protein
LLEAISKAVADLLFWFRGRGSLLLSSRPVEALALASLDRSLLSQPAFCTLMLDRSICTLTKRYNHQPHTRSLLARWVDPVLVSSFG